MLSRNCHNGYRVPRHDRRRSIGEGIEWEASRFFAGSVLPTVFQDRQTACMAMLPGVQEQEGGLQGVRFPVRYSSKEMALEFASFRCIESSLSRASRYSATLQRDEYVNEYYRTAKVFIPQRFYLGSSCPAGLRLVQPHGVRPQHHGRTGLVLRSVYSVCQ